MLEIIGYEYVSMYAEVQPYMLGMLGKSLKRLPLVLSRFRNLTSRLISHHQQARRRLLQ